MTEVVHSLLINAPFPMECHCNAIHVYTRHMQAYQDSRHEGSSVGRGEKAKTSEDESNEGHEEDLSSTSHTHGQQHRSSRGTENITMDQLPTKVLLNILL